MTATFVARFSPWRRAAGIAGCLGFVALGLWLAGVVGRIDQPAPLAGWLGIIVFGGFAMLGTVTIMRAGEAVRVDAGGLWKFDRHGGKHVAWSYVSGVREIRIHRQSYLCVDLVPNGPAMPRGRMEAAFGDMTLGTQGTDGRFADLRDAVAAYHPID